MHMMKNHTDLKVSIFYHKGMPFTYIFAGGSKEKPPWQSL